MSSLENRGNGSWRLTISDGYAPDGKKIRFQRTIHVDPMHTPAVQRREAGEAGCPAGGRLPAKAAADGQPCAAEAGFRGVRRRKAAGRAESLQHPLLHQSV